MENRFIFAGAGLVLMIGVGLQFTAKRDEIPVSQRRDRIAEVVPGTVPGWLVTDEPLGSTESATGAALKILNLDDYVYRRFRNGVRSFTVYAAYWAPGRMPTRLVALHTPDRCWTENGMRCVDMRFRETYLAMGKPLLPAEYRVFTPPSGGDRTYVAYWLTVNGHLYDFGARFNAIPHPWLWWKDTLAQAAYGSREQLFVRIASETPFEQLWREPGFQSVMEKVASLGLFEASAR